jgi:hypothetical protein
MGMRSPMSISRPLQRASRRPTEPRRSHRRVAPALLVCSGLGQPFSRRTVVVFHFGQCLFHVGKDLPCLDNEIWIGAKAGDHSTLTLDAEPLITNFLLSWTVFLAASAGVRIPGQLRTRLISSARTKLAPQSFQSFGKLPVLQTFLMGLESAQLLRELEAAR